MISSRLGRGVPSWTRNSDVGVGVGVAVGVGVLVMVGVKVGRGVRVGVPVGGGGRLAVGVLVGAAGGVGVQPHAAVISARQMMDHRMREAGLGSRFMAVLSRCYCSTKARNGDWDYNGCANPGSRGCGGDDRAAKPFS
jgi:hypothetical protein